MALWRKLAAESPEYRTALQSSAITTLATEHPPSAKLTSFELTYRTKLNAKRAASGVKGVGGPVAEGPSLADWLRGLQPPTAVVAKPEFATWFDSEHSILKAMRCRRNDTFWPWMINAGLVPCEVSGVDAADVPTPLRNLLGEVFLRLVALPPCKPDPVTGESPSALPQPVFTWFFTTLCHLLYPGSQSATAAFVAEEWRLSSVTNVSLSTAAWLRRDMGPDGTTPARRVTRAKADAAPSPTAPGSTEIRKRKSDKNQPSADAEQQQAMITLSDVTEDAEPSVSFPLFAALLRVLAEPLTVEAAADQRQQANNASMDPAMTALKETMNLLEGFVVPHCFRDDSVRRYLRSNKPGTTASAATAAGTPASTVSSPSEPMSPIVKPKTVAAAAPTLEHTISAVSLRSGGIGGASITMAAGGVGLLPSVGRPPRSSMAMSNTPVPTVAPSTSLLLAAQPERRCVSSLDVTTPPEKASRNGAGFLSTAIASAVAKTQLPQISQIKLPPILLPLS